MKKFLSSILLGLILHLAPTQVVAYTLTPNYNFYLPGVNDPADANNWGTYLNDNFSSLDTLIATLPSGTLTSAHIYVGDASNLPASVAVSGDLSLANTGAFTINSNAVTLSKLATQAADTVLANATSGSAVPTAVSIPQTRLFGRGSTGDIAAISVGSGLALSGTTLSATGTFTPAFTSSLVSMTTGSHTYTIAHGLGSVPNFYTIVLVCQSPEQGYSAGDEIKVDSTNDLGGAGGWGSEADATNINLFQYVAIAAYNKTTPSPVTLTAADWKIKVRAW